MKTSLLPVAILCVLLCSCKKSAELTNGYRISESSNGVVILDKEKRKVVGPGVNEIWGLHPFIYGYWTERTRGEVKEFLLDVENGEVQLDQRKIDKFFKITGADRCLGPNMLTFDDLFSGLSEEKKALFYNRIRKSEAKRE